MTKYLLLLAPFVVLNFFVLIMAYTPEKTDNPERKAASDSTQTLPTFEFYYSSLPDSVKQVISEKELYDDLKSCYEKNISETNMPIFIPDSSLTASMPILITPPVDEEMIIPGLRCPEYWNRR